MKAPWTSAGSALLRWSPYILALALFLGARAAVAQNGIYNVTNAGSGLFSTTPNGATSSATNVIDLQAGPGPIQFFRSRDAFNVNADAGFEETRAHEASVVHQINFEVRSDVNYALSISTALIGELTWRSDESECSGTADVTGVTGNASDALESGSLNLDDPGFLSGGLIERIDVLQTGNAIIRVNGGPETRTFALGFGWIGSVNSNSCEVAVRLGGSSGATQGCDACGYPGTPPRSASDDGHIVFVDYIPGLCGNGSVDFGEECDNGAENGPQSCCDDTCKLSGAPCAATPTASPTASPSPTTTPTPRATPTLPMAGCEPPFNAGSYNVNGANCTFCQVIGSACSTECLGPPACICETGDAECCAATPCCIGCPDEGSLECSKLTCTCNPESNDCCATLCPCAGDCNGDAHTSVNELVKGVAISKELLPLGDCVSFNPERDGQVRIEELVIAVNVALRGCGGEP